VAGNAQTVAELLPWLQLAIAEHFPESKYHVERMGGKSSRFGWNDEHSSPGGTNTSPWPHEVA